MSSINFTQEQERQLQSLLAAAPVSRDPFSASELLGMLRSIRERFGSIPVQAYASVARHFGIPESQVHATASFYPELSEKRKLRHDLERRLERGFRVLSPEEPIEWCGAPDFQGQTRRVLARCGVLDPMDLQAFRAAGSYEGLKRAREMSPEQVIEVIAASGLRGRGGAGFATARKWRTAREASAEQKFLVCNAAEGDLGAWMDRAILEGDPHLVFEGMAIAAHAVGATHSYLYLRAEYAHLIPKLERVLGLARAAGLFGASFDMEIFLAAGAYVCGEETALLNSMEGKAGRPRIRPPFPAQAGLWGMPTVVNNVKTLAQVPLILRNGAEWFAGVGTSGSKGTAILCLGGDIERPGVVEVAMGTPLIEVLEKIGKGVRGGGKVKAVQTGGPLGGFLGSDQLNTPISFEDFSAAGSPLGSGGLIVISEDRCMVDIARDFSVLAREESCGNCAPCRLGTEKLAEILDRMARGRGANEDLETIESLGEMLTSASFCAFGQGAPAVTLSAMRRFRKEFEEHVQQRECSAGVCSLFGATSGVKK